MDDKHDVRHALDVFHGLLTALNNDIKRSTNENIIPIDAVDLKYKNAHAALQNLKTKEITD